jgi:lysophospholipase L1-like esterase
MTAAHANRDLRLDDIHLSPLGHRVLARTMFEWLVDQRLVPYRHVRPGAADVD